MVDKAEVVDYCYEKLRKGEVVCLEDIKRRFHVSTNTAFTLMVYARDSIPHTKIRFAKENECKSD